MVAGCAKILSPQLWWLVLLLHRLCFILILIAPIKKCIIYPLSLNLWYSEFHAIARLRPNSSRFCTRLNTVENDVYGQCWAILCKYDSTILTIHCTYMMVCSCYLYMMYDMSSTINIPPFNLETLILKKSSSFLALKKSQ